MKLIQKVFLKGTREFEIVDDVINVSIKSRLKEERLTVVLSIVNPDPAVNGSFLDFYSRVKADDVLFSLYLDKPNADEFNAFVNALKRRARGEFHAFTGLRDGGMGRNPQEPPVDFDDASATRVPVERKPVNVESIETSIRMLEQFVDAEEIAAVLGALRALKAEPDDPSAYDQLASAFAELGQQQGAVLTYAPYVGILLSDDPLG